ncbi:hypothetical protein ACFL3C_02280 [Patescibacteria group bacterium]
MHIYPEREGDRMTQQAKETPEARPKKNLIHVIMLGIRFLRIIPKREHGLMSSTSEEKTFEPIREFTGSDAVREDLLRFARLHVVNEKEGRFFDLEDFGWGMGVPPNPQIRTRSFLGFVLCDGRRGVVSWANQEVMLLEYSNYLPTDAPIHDGYYEKTPVFGKRVEWLSEFLVQLSELEPESPNPG